MQQLEFSSHPLSEAGVNGNAMSAPPALADSWGAQELAATLDSVGTGIWALDLEGRCVFINQAACRTLGYRREECLGAKIQCRIHAGHCSGWVCPKEACRVQGALRSGSAVQVDDDVFRRHDGTSIAVEYSVQPVVVEGRLRGSVLWMNETASSFLRTLIERLPDLIYAKDNQGRFLLANSSVAKLMGAPVVSHLLGKTDFDFYPKELAAKYHADEQRICQTGEPLVDLEEPGVDPEGRPRWLLTSKVPFRDGSGKIIGLVGLGRDITGRKLAEEALRESEARHRLLFDGSRDAMMTMAAPSWKFTSGNPAALEMFGARDAAEFTVLGPWDVSPERQPDGRSSADKIQEAVETALREGSLFFEWTHRRPDGTDFPATVLITRMEMAGQAFLQATVRDITAQKQAEERIEKTLMRQRGVSRLQQLLLAPAPLEDQLRKVTEAVVGAFDADICRIWLIRPGDLCERGCPHAEVHEGPHVCRQRDRCLHLLASSVRDTVIDGPGLRRVPFGCYNIGLVASDDAPKVVSHDVQNDPRFHNRAWAREVGLVSFAGYQLRTPGEETLGVLALFAKHPILADEDAMLEGLGSTVALIVKRAAAEDALRRSEERFRQIVANAGEGITLVDAEERFEFANPAAETIFGVPPNGLVGRNLREFLGSEELRRVLEETAKRRAGLQSCYELEIRRPDGAMRQILLTAEPSLTGEGQFKGTFAVIRDITERKRAEAALAEEALRRRMVFEQSRDGIVILDRSGKVRESNQSFANMLGYSLEEMLQLHISDWDDHFTRDQVLEMVGDGESPPRTLETRHKRKDGSLFDAEISSIYVRLHGDVFCYCMVRDITERKRMVQAMELHAEKLARSNAELERFAYVASHDLQEPLRMVASFTQLLAKRYSGQLDETADRYINFAVDGARRMQQLIADLLAYSRVNSKQLDLRQTECEAVVVGAMQNLQAAIDESGASVDWDPLPVLWVDQGQFTQLFQNLLGNAIKFRRNGEGPRVHISAVDSGAEWTISVQDNGIGIDPRHADRIFEIFQRLHTREQYPGTGIGLAVCQKVAERHGGKIWVESEPGVGSTFRFTIPKRQMDGVVDDRGE